MKKTKKTTKATKKAPIKNQLAKAELEKIKGGSDGLDFTTLSTTQEIRSAEF